MFLTIPKVTILINSENNGIGKRQFSKSYTAYSCFNLLAFQPFWEFKPFEKQLSSAEKQILKPAIQLNLDFMKQNERENQRI